MPDAKPLSGTTATFEDKARSNAPKVEPSARTPKTKMTSSKFQALSKSQEKAKSGNVFEMRDNLISSIALGMQFVLAKLLEWMGVDRRQAMEWVGITNAKDRQATRRSREAQAERQAATPKASASKGGSRTLMDLMSRASGNSAKSSRNLDDEDPSVKASQAAPEAAGPVAGV